MSIVQFSTNSTDRIYLSVGYYICKNINKLEDENLEIIQVPTNFKMRPIYHRRFVSPDSPCIYYSFGIFEAVIFLECPCKQRFQTQIRYQQNP